MKKLMSFVPLLFLTISIGQAQTPPANYEVLSGTGNGYRFFGPSDYYKISAGGGTEYTYGPVTDLSIKMHMSPAATWPGRGWVWGEGVAGVTPVAALGVQGDMQIAGRFTSSKIGIGIASPYEKFHISATHPNIRLGNLADAGSYNGEVGAILFYKHYDYMLSSKIYSSTQSAVDGFNGADLRFATTPPASYGSGNLPLTDRMVINSIGNVGIGTVTPSQKLTVNGTIYGKEVKVDLSVPGPDYVFEKSYSLPTLAEVKSYIDQNKHLPEVPSAKEMDKDGVKLGEMNMLLLKKVEELTLYILEQEKRIKALEEKNK